MYDKQPDQRLQVVITAMEKAGYNPYEQLEGYIQTGRDVFITRKDGARDLITQISREDICEYLSTRKRKRGSRKM